MQYICASHVHAPPYVCRWLFSLVPTYDKNWHILYSITAIIRSYIHMYPMHSSLKEICMYRRTYIWLFAPLFTLCNDTHTTYSTVSCCWSVSLVVEVGTSTSTTSTVTDVTPRLPLWKTVKDNCRCTTWFQSSRYVDMYMWVHQVEMRAQVHSWENDVLMILHSTYIQ